VLCAGGGAGARGRGGDLSCVRVCVLVCLCGNVGVWVCAHVARLRGLPRAALCRGASALQVPCSVRACTPRRCRRDYIRYADHSAAVGGVLQALLLTKTMLFVGFSLEVRGAPSCLQACPALTLLPCGPVPPGLTLFV
jgi:hypothetical protein